jgi:hypothetical protein
MASILAAQNSLGRLDNPIPLHSFATAVLPCNSQTARRLRGFRNRNRNPTRNPFGGRSASANRLASAVWALGPAMQSAFPSIPLPRAPAACSAGVQSSRRAGPPVQSDTPADGKGMEQGNRVWNCQSSDFGFGFRISFGFRPSDFGFGFRIYFGFRPSDFGFGSFGFRPSDFGFPGDTLGER